MSFLQNFRPEDDLLESKSSHKIHLRKQQRNGRKCITLVEGIQVENDAKLLKTMKKKFSCGGALIKDDDKVVYKLSGDQRLNISKLLIKNDLATQEQIVMHGA